MESEFLTLFKKCVLGLKECFFVAQTNGLLLLGVAIQSNPLSEIAIELRLGFQIPESELAISGLIGGPKEAVGQIHGAILGV